LRRWPTACLQGAGGTRLQATFPQGSVPPTGTAPIGKSARMASTTHGWSPYTTGAYGHCARI
ncbi:unnamed protein product, partial [Musa textilis]